MYSKNILNSIKKVVFLFAAIVLLFPACQEDLYTDETQLTAQDPEKEEILDYLASLEFNIDSVEFKGDAVIYSRDAHWTRAELLRQSRGEYELMNGEDPDGWEDVNAGDRQRAYSEGNLLNAVTRANVQDIRYYIRLSVAAQCGSSWESRIVAAAEEWNDLSNCRVNFIRIGSPWNADLTITCDTDLTIPANLQNLPIAVVAAANLSNNGSVGAFISINNGLDWIPKKKTAIMHEMGHVLGFFHTDETDETDENSVQLVFGTPESQFGSIMNSSIWSSSSNLKSGDIRMARLYYPSNLSRPTFFSASNVGNGRVRIRYRNPDVVNRPYYWVRVMKYTSSGTPIDVRYIRSTAGSGTHSVFWSGHTSGDYMFAIRGYNFRRDVYSSRTDQEEVSF